MTQMELFAAAAPVSECGCPRIRRGRHFRLGRVMEACGTCCAQWDAATGVYQGDVEYPSKPIILPDGEVWEGMGLPPSHSERLSILALDATRLLVYYRGGEWWR